VKDFELIIKVSMGFSKHDPDVPLYAVAISELFQQVCAKLPALDLANTKKDIVDTLKEALDKVDTLDSNFQKALNEAEGQ